MKYIFGLAGAFLGGIIALLLLTATLPWGHSAYGDPALVFKYAIEGDSEYFFIIFAGAFVGLFLGFALGNSKFQNVIKQVIATIPSPQVKLSSTQNITCPSCKTLIGANAQFCTNCGYKLKTICPGCKAQNDSSAKFCVACGHSIQEDEKIEIQ